MGSSYIGAALIAIALAVTVLGYAGITILYKESTICMHACMVVDVRRENGERYFLTRGDANDDSDSWLIPESRVIGKAVGKIPFLGYITTIPKMYLVILGALLITIDVFLARQTNHTRLSR